jgi:hypothetical protein
VHGSRRAIAEPARKTAAIQLQWNSLGNKPFEQPHPARVHGGGDGEVRVCTRRDKRPVPPRIACLRQVIYWQVEERPQMIDDVRFLEEDCIVWPEQHQLTPQARYVIRKPERYARTPAPEVSNDAGHQTRVDVDNYFALRV